MFCFCLFVWLFFFLLFFCLAVNLYNTAEINLYKYLQNYHHLVELYVALSSKTLQRLFSIIYFKQLVYLLSGHPVFTKVPPSLATPVQRTTYRVVCQAEGFPRPVINWRRVGMPALPAGRTEVNQGTLIIKKLIPADSGLYECVATNTMGTKKARTNVAVQQIPGMRLILF